MAKWYEILIPVLSIGGGAGALFLFRDKIFGTKEEEPIPNEPFAAGLLDINSERGTLESSPGSISSAGPSASSVGSDNLTEELPEGRVRVITVPIDSEAELIQRLDPSIQQVNIEAPETFVSDDGQFLIDAIQQLQVFRNQDGTTTEQTVFLLDGKQFNSRQELLDEFIRLAAPPEELAAISGQSISTLDALRTGAPIDATAFLTSRPDFFPEAAPDAISTEFQRRARALESTLTVSNPGGSSVAGIPNFSRLAAVGTDLSKVDLYSVQNPDFLGSIKSGQGPLTAEQRRLVDQQRLAIDPRNQTSSDRLEIARNQAINAVQRELREQRAAQITKAGFDEQAAKALLLSKGLRVTGGLTANQFAALEARLGTSLVKECINCDLGKIQSPSVPATLDGVSLAERQKIESFLRQTGRTDLSNLSIVERTVLNRVLES
jgi:hypothetical protein